MDNMLETIVPKSDQLNADDLIGRNMTITIKEVRITGGDQPVSIYFEGDQGKPYKPCKSMRRVLVNVWKEDAKQYIGQSMTIHRDETVTFGGAAVGGIRISHMTGISKPVTMALTATRASRKMFTVHPLKPLQTSADEMQTTDESEDKAAKMADDMIAHVQGLVSVEALKEFTALPRVVKTRAVWAEKRSDLAKRVDDAVAEALAMLELG